MANRVLGCAVILALLGFNDCYKIFTKTSDADLQLGEQTTIIIDASGEFETGGTAIITAEHKELVDIQPSIISLNSSPPWRFEIKALEPGHTAVSINVTNSSSEVNFDDAFVRVTTLRSHALVTTSTVIGWIYFAAWSVSFYPQFYENWRRKSVVGLNFDFLSLNIIGFILYSLYNCGLYWVPEIRAEYLERNPKGLIPVQPNDIVFSVHASIITFFTIIQCFLYERGGQTVSLLARIIIGTFAVILTVSFILPFPSVIHWLDFLNICAYVKLAITLIKYIPQAYMNYTRKSTIGWSIGNVLLDFTGGLLSMLQMILNAQNYDDWGSLFGDATKFGLGLFSVLFDIFFIVQHYILYREQNLAILRQRAFARVLPQSVAGQLVLDLETEKSGSARPLIS